VADINPHTSFGNYSTVWRGSWQGQIVAIKELNSLTDKEVRIARRVDYTIADGPVLSFS
jgi:hypothetical protein